MAGFSSDNVHCAQRVVVEHERYACINPTCYGRSRRSHFRLKRGYNEVIDTGTYVALSPTIIPCTYASSFITKAACGRPPYVILLLSLRLDPLPDVLGITASWVFRTGDVRSTIWAVMPPDISTTATRPSVHLLIKVI